MKNLGQTLNSLGFELFWVLQKSLLYQDFVDFEALSAVARGMIEQIELVRALDSLTESALPDLAGEASGC